MWDPWDMASRDAVMANGLWLNAHKPTLFNHRERKEHKSIAPLRSLRSLWLIAPLLFV